MHYAPCHLIHSQHLRIKDCFVALQEQYLFYIIKIIKIDRGFEVKQPNSAIQRV